jgi:AmmeMemoRadiSam system protein B
MAANVRHPAVAGRFYPSEPDVLQAEVHSYLSHTATTSALGCIVPHAGYMYSGHVAGAVYSELTIPNRCILLCPNHTGRGQALAIMSEGEWETPLGKVSLDSELANVLKEKFSLLSEDNEAHCTEHAIEVQLPFLQVRNPKFTFVPIALGIRQFEVLEALGLAIAEVLTQQSKPVLIIASSDMNHYENDQITRVKDHKAIDQILTLNPRGLFDVIMQEEISMCGFGPAVVMLTTVKQLGALRADLVKYATSGDISGDRNMVVGYAGIIVK